MSVPFFLAGKPLGAEGKWTALEFMISDHLRGEMNYLPIRVTATSSTPKRSFIAMSILTSLRKCSPGKRFFALLTWISFLGTSRTCRRGSVELTNGHSGGQCHCWWYIYADRDVGSRGNRIDN
jgi:hypothetical protein